MPRRNSRKRMNNNDMIFKSDIEISRDLAADRVEYIEMNNLSTEPKKTEESKKK